MKRSILSIALPLAMAAEAQSSAGAPAAEKVKFCDKEYDVDSGIAYFTFGNGTKLELDSNSLNEEMRKQLMLHGISQKVGDSFAGVKGNYAEGIQNAKDVIEQLLAGEWKAGRDDSARPRLAELAAAIARIKNVELDKATAAVEKATDEQRKSWRSNAKVKAVIAQLRAEKAAKALEEAGAQAEIEVAL